MLFHRLNIVERKFDVERLDPTIRCIFVVHIIARIDSTTARNWQAAIASATAQVARRMIRVVAALTAELFVRGVFAENKTEV